LHEKDLHVITPGKSSGNTFSGFRFSRCCCYQHAGLKLTELFSFNDGTIFLYIVLKEGNAII